MEQSARNWYTQVAQFRNPSVRNSRTRALAWFSTKLAFLPFLKFKLTWQHFTKEEIIILRTYIWTIWSLRQCCTRRKIILIKKVLILWRIAHMLEGASRRINCQSHSSVSFTRRTADCCQVEPVSWAQVCCWQFYARHRYTWPGPDKQADRQMGTQLPFIEQNNSLRGLTFHRAVKKDS